MGKFLLVFLTIIATYAAISLLMAFPVMWCWNFAVVAVFGLPKITWGMAWCLMFLFQLFFKANVNVNES